MIILLVLLPALVSGAREKIDWTKCALEVACFCGDAGDPPLLEQRVDDGQGCEKVGVQSQFFTENSALIQVQLTVDLNDPVLNGPNPRLIVQYGPKKLFGCEYDIKNKKVKLSGDGDRDFFDYKIKLFEEKFEERSYLDANSAVCAVTVGRASKLDEKIISPLLNEKIAIMWMSGDSEVNSKKFEARIPGKTLFIHGLQAIRCNPSFKELSHSPDYYIKPLRNKDRLNLNCADYGASYTMRYEKAGAIKEMKHLNCTKNGKVYSYTIDTSEKDDTGVTNDVVINVPDPESYTIFCTATFNELCKNPNTCTKDDDPNCPDYKPGSKGTAAILNCTDNKWKIKDEFYELDELPACKRNTVLKANGASFEAVLPSGQRVPITEDLARCFTDWDCKKRSNLNIPSGSVLIDNGIMKCNETEATMIVYHYETNTTMTGAQSYKCNPAEGVFFNEANVAEKIQENSRVSCRVNKTISTSTQASISREQVIYVIAGVAVLLILVVIGVAVCGFCCWRHRNDVSIKNLQALNRNALAEKCKKDFRNILKVGPSNAYLIVDGFTLVDKMLEMEVDDPQAWEEAGKFLTRCHGSIMRSDFQVWHMLSRYCHMQAMKIIDKYTWRTETPITKDNPKGQIRAVAVNLLAFCLNDQANYTAEEQLEFGFSKLGWRGSSQYPHAGVLWAIVPHARRGAYLRAPKQPHLLVYGFNKATFCKITREIACKKIPIAIPDHDVIPEFGTVEEQAAYALGGVPRHTYLAKQTNDILFGTPELAAVCAPTAYLRGMIESRGRDPAQILLESCKMLTWEKEEFLAKMNLLAPEPVWHNVWRNGFQLLAMYGRDLDIQRIHSSFMPKDKSTDFFEMQREQANFEKAIDSALEDVRKWLAKHTDKDEFKKKKATKVVNPKVKLRDRKFDVGPAGGCSTSDKSSGAGKPPAAAAAAAGTPVAAGTAPAPRAAGSPGAAAPTAPAAPTAGPPGAAAAAAPAAGPPIAAPAAAAPAAAPPIAAPAAVPTAPIAPTPTP